MVSSLLSVARQRSEPSAASPRHVFHDTPHDTPIVASHIRTRDLRWSGATLRIEHDARFDESRTIGSLALTCAAHAFLTKPIPSHQTKPTPSNQWIFRYQSQIVRSSS